MISVMFNEIEILKSVQITNELKIIEDILISKNINLDNNIIINAIDKSIIDKNNKIINCREQFKMNLLKEKINYELKNDILKICDYMFDKKNVNKNIFDLENILKYMSIIENENNVISNEDLYNNIMNKYIEIGQLFYDNGLEVMYEQYYGTLFSDTLYTSISFTNDINDIIKLNTSNTNLDRIWIKKIEK